MQSNWNNKQFISLLEEAVKEPADIWDAKKTLIMSCFTKPAIISETNLQELQLQQA